MSTNNTLKTVSLNAMIDKHIGKCGTVKRETFESELQQDLHNKNIKKVRKYKSK